MTRSRDAVWYILSPAADLQTQYCHFTYREDSFTFQCASILWPCRTDELCCLLLTFSQNAYKSAVMNRLLLCQYKKVKSLRWKLKHIVKKSKELVLSQKNFFPFCTASLHVHIPDVIVERLAHLLILSQYHASNFLSETCCPNSRRLFSSARPGKYRDIT
jgi:hypothetical protein